MTGDRPPRPAKHGNIKFGGGKGAPNKSTGMSSYERKFGNKKVVGQEDRGRPVKRDGQRGVRKDSSGKRMKGREEKPK